MKKVKQYDWEKDMNLNLFIMNLMGLWPKNDENYKSGLYMIYSRFIMTFIIIGHIFPQLANIYVSRNDLQAVAGITYVTLIDIMATIKGLFVIKNMKILKKLMMVLRSDWFQLKKKDHISLIRPSITFWKVIYRMFLLMCFTCDAFFIIYPLMDTSEVKRLPFLASYPYDSQISPFYEISFVVQIVCTTYMILISANVDSLISGFNVYSGCHFDILCDSLRSFRMNSSTSSNVRNNLKECIIYHKKILSFIQSCSEFFNGIMVWHLIISGVSIGITMFMLTIVVPFSNEFYSILSYGWAIVIQIFMYCWFGNEVTTKSDLASYAAFESEWTDLPKEVKKDLLFFTANLTKPVRLSALNIFELSLETFMSILKTAWSYFALFYQLTP